ncbi:MAG: bifunctional 2-polyprenyl-6-hydroxyphenol methylase/3-demethylubiquinol 3-O-methyltransferase UbiG [Chromatiales bacterium]|nr:MAG: bifunctional 2-polyprenyl-6-hydroxyphenol methylase/3-demethylubiquinol 3-O-methyltransferase UbiG [Chromatiales bacterium]
MEATKDPNADAAELAHFAALANKWWDPGGEMRGLHQINPLRLDYIDAQAGIAGKTCLDVGCGGGLLSEGLASRGAGSVLGIDLAEDMLRVARLHASATTLDNLEYRLVDADTLAAEAPGHFDLVTCLEVLEHVPDPGALVRALGQLVAPGGNLVLATLNRTPKAFALAIVGAEYFLGMVPKGTHQYERFIRPSEMDDWAREAGLELAGLRGIEYQPLAGNFRLSDDVAVNYLAHFRRGEH